MKTKSSYVVPWVIAGVVMAVIFFFSSQNGESSGSISDEIALFALGIFYPEYFALPVEEAAVVFDTCCYIVRKCAHFVIYFCLGAPLMVAFYNMPLWQEDSNKIRAFRSMGNAAAVGIIYAISDEFHQFFIVERSGQILDVGIDSLGVIAGLFIAAAVLHIIDRKTAAKLH